MYHTLFCSGTRESKKGPRTPEFLIGEPLASWDSDRCSTAKTQSTPRQMKLGKGQSNKEVLWALEMLGRLFDCQVPWLALQVFGRLGDWTPWKARQHETIPGKKARWFVLIASQLARTSF